VNREIAHGPEYKAHDASTAGDPVTVA